METAAGGTRPATRQGRVTPGEPSRIGAPTTAKVWPRARSLRTVLWLGWTIFMAIALLPALVIFYLHGAQMLDEVARLGERNALQAAFLGRTIPHPARELRFTDPVFAPLIGQPATRAASAITAQGFACTQQTAQLVCRRVDSTRVCRDIWRLILPFNRDHRVQTVTGEKRLHCRTDM